MKKILYEKQTDLKDCGVACLGAITKYYGGYATKEYLRELTNTTDQGVSAYSLIEAGQQLGFEVKALKGDITFVKDQTPFIAHVIQNKLGHFVVVIKINDNNLTIMDPSKGIIKLSKEKWQEITTNVYLLYKPKTTILKQEEKSLKSLLTPILKKYKTSVLIIFILSLIYTIGNILISYQFQFFLELLGYQDKFTLKIIFYFLLLVIFLKELSNLWRDYLINFVNHTLDKTLLKDTYTHITKLPYLYFKNRMKGDIVTRIQDVFTIRDAISKLFITLIIDLILIIILFITFLKINFKLSMITIFITTIYIIIINIYNKVITPKIKELKQEESLVNNHLIETFDSINTVKNMQIEEMLCNKLMLKYKKLQEISFNLYKRFYEESFFKNFLIGIGFLIIAYFGIKEVLIDKISLGNLLVFNSLLSYYFTPLQNICNLQIILKDAELSFLRIKELFNVSEEQLEIDRKSISTHLQGNIKLKDLNYSYNSEDSILQCDNLEIKAGSHVLVYGSSGSGKSTFMKLLMKFMTNYKGSIYLDNLELSNYNINDIRNRLTYISQDEVIYTDTVYNNIVLNNTISYEKYLNILKITGVDKIIGRSILKDEMVLENNASNLSGGERQRILLARALVKNGDLYIFDEAFSAIDIKTERIILKNIFKYLKNKTVIVISHRFNNKDLYQKFVLIEKGVVYEY